MRIPARAIVVVAIVSAGAALMACAMEPKATRVVYRITASPDLNPNDANQSSPVVVRLFELQSTGRFESAEFFALFNDEASALGPTLVARKEVQVWPSEKKKLTEELQPTTRMIGIMAAFRNISAGQWRSVVAVEKGKTKFVDVRLDRTSITASAGQEE